MNKFTTARKATLTASPVFSLSMLVGCVGIASIPATAIAQLQDNSTPETKLPEVALAQSDRIVSVPEVAATDDKVAKINSTTESELSSTAAAQPPPTTTKEVATTDIPNQGYPLWLSQSPVLNPQSPVIAEVKRIPDLPAETGSAADLGDQNDFAQVTSVSQLSDVQPTDWAFQALQSLVERYGCIAGYPDGTFRGNRALTRYEFAAGLNACLDQVNRLIAGGTNNLATKEDLIALQRLQEEFAAELATLRGRVDALESRTAELEANQFSTTTKLSGLAWFNVTGATANKRVRVETTNTDTPLALRPAGRDPITNRPVVQKVDDPEVTFSQLVWLTLTTSFTGKDQLVTQLAVGNGDSPANQFASAGLYNTFGTPFLDQTGGVNANEFILRELFYQFPLSDRLQVVVGPRINFYRYFDNNAFTFFLNGASTFNSNGSTLSNAVDRGAGAVALWDVSRRFKVRLGYLGESDEFLPTGVFNSASDPSKGFFNGTNSATIELAFSPSNRANLRFLYTRSNIQQVGGQVGGAIGEPIYGVADDGYGGKIGNATADTFVFNFDWLVARNFGLFGRYSYGRTNIFPRTDRPDGTIKAQAYQMGVAFPDLGKQGALLTLSFLVPFDVTGGRKFLVSGGGNGGTQYEFEATYYLPISDNIAIVPAFYLIGNANNFDNNPTIYVGNLRTQFSF
ncbi:iron uptake porin [Kamptonema sp. UHCC 0994]|uniref:iron uptake porin n=1 Tax=Kamptonema sp. UHCC 0994 TaxID=3031329 RepID=UPI0023B921BB|nr:iron uptake porin [Kamptonema sp. UHCC 0994]MDF0555139.1 iron uptake porin [Kamptonema sp. UHCC 0994]